MVLIKVKEYLYRKKEEKPSYVYEYIFINESLKHCKEIIQKFIKIREEKLPDQKIEYEYRILQDFFMWYHNKKGELISKPFTIEDRADKEPETEDKEKEELF